MTLLGGCVAFFEPDPVTNQVVIHSVDREHGAVLAPEQDRQLGHRDVPLRLDRAQHYVSERLDARRPQVVTLGWVDVDPVARNTRT